MLTNRFAFNRHYHRPQFSRWGFAIIIIALLMALPILVIASFVFQPNNENWQHLVDNLLGEYVKNSLILMLGVSAGVLSMGVITAWLTSMCDFPGRRLFSWTLLLPLAIPAILLLTPIPVYWISQDLFKPSYVTGLVGTTVITGFLRCAPWGAQLPCYHWCYTPMFICSLALPF